MSYDQVKNLINQQKKYFHSSEERLCHGATSQENVELAKKLACHAHYEFVIA